MVTAGATATAAHRNRLRFALEVLRAIREEAARHHLIKMNQRDGMPGGLEMDEALLVAQAFEAREPAHWCRRRFTAKTRST